IQFVRMLESLTGYPAIIDAKPLPPADPPRTYANISRAQAQLGFAPQTPLEVGLAAFWKWYRSEYDI
ncbi:MAG: epimerase, partial [Roseiflexaceae bacterium]